MALKVVKTGTFLYAETKEIPVRIVELDMRPGTGDYEDEPEVENDLPGTWYEIQYGSISGEPTRFPSRRGYYLTLQEAISVAESSVSNLKWNKSCN